MLNIIGLGLGWKDLSIRAFEILKECDLVYLESYTSISHYTLQRLEELISKKVQALDRKQVEENQEFIEKAKAKKVALLVHGDPLSATTHFEILKEAKKQGIETEIFHASSIFTAVAETGLSMYRFGKTASIPFEREGFKPKSFFAILKENLLANAHTLFLLDLDPSSGKFLSVQEAVERLQDSDYVDERTKFIGCSKLATPAQIIKVGTASELKEVDFGEPPYCLIVPAKLNFKEEEYLNG